MKRAYDITRYGRTRVSPTFFVTQTTRSTSPNRQAGLIPLVILLISGVHPTFFVTHHTQHISKSAVGVNPPRNTTNKRCSPPPSSSHTTRSTSPSRQSGLTPLVILLISGVHPNISAVPWRAASVRGHVPTPGACNKRQYWPVVVMVYIEVLEVVLVITT